METVNEMIKKVDHDQTGQIEYREFLQLMAEEMEAQQLGEELIEAFKRFGPKNENESFSKA